MVYFLVHLRVLGRLLSVLGVQDGCVTVWGHFETTGMFLPCVEVSYMYVYHDTYPDTSPLRRLVTCRDVLGLAMAFCDDLHTSDSFGWDNEYGSREYEVPSFEASKHMVSNGEYIEFVKDAGYARQELWSESGWRWKMFRNVKRPPFWVPEVSCTVLAGNLASTYKSAN